MKLIALSLAVFLMLSSAGCSKEAETSEDAEWHAALGNTDRRLQMQLNNTGLVRVSPAATGDDGGPVTPPVTETTVIIEGRFDE